MKKLLSVLGLTAIMVVNGGNVVQAQNVDLVKGINANTVQINKLEYERLKRIEEVYEKYGNENDELTFENMNLKQDAVKNERLIQHLLNVNMHMMKVIANVKEYNETKFEEILKVAEKSEYNREILQDSMKTLIINSNTLNGLVEDVRMSLFGE